MPQKRKLKGLIKTKRSMKSVIRRRSPGVKAWKSVKNIVDLLLDLRRDHDTLDYRKIIGRFAGEVDSLKLILLHSPDMNKRDKHRFSKISKSLDSKVQTLVKALGGGKRSKKRSNSRSRSRSPSTLRLKKSQKSGLTVSKT
jgi:hypothetical protein